MSWRWPRSLFGRVALVVCGGLAVAHLLTFCIILRERSEQGLRMMEAYVGRDVAAAVAILDRLPPAERPAWLPRLARQNYGYRLAAPPPVGPAMHPLAAPVAAAVARELGAAIAGPMVQDPSPRLAAPRLYLPLRLADGSPLTLQLSPPPPRVSRTTVLLLALQLAALGAAAWWAVRLAVRPLSAMAEAADAMTPGQGGPVLPGEGPSEVARAARAFNALQRRIDTHLAERMQLLAAISHDLQTPITRMRLRCEQVADPSLRARLQEDLAGMALLVDEGLAYARTAHAAQEAPRPVDLHALLDALVCDAVDAGHRVVLQGRHDQPLVTRVQALRRIVNNLLDNAIKFSGQAWVQVVTSGDQVHILVCDDGPGIPQDELIRVLQPFYRVESSRSRQTGGTGLGLAIAHQLAQALPGTLALRNRPEGGLEARLTLPAVS